MSAGVALGGHLATGGAAAGDWTGALIGCGTSRAVVVRADELPRDDRQALAILEHRMGGSSPGSGLGGGHYQQNKLAVVAPLNAHPGFRFRFFQADERTGEISGDLECANVSAAAALFGLLDGMVEFDPAGRLHGLNEGTGRLVTFEPDRTGEPWSTTWMVRFLYPDGLTVPVLSRLEPLKPLPPSWPVDVWLAEHGNVFLLADVDPRTVTADLVHALARAGATMGPDLGADPARAEHAKILAYRVKRADRYSIHALARCFYRDQAHQSLPGSGAMFLAAFLVRALAEPLGVGPEGAAPTVYLHHPGGIVPVTVHVEAGPNGLRVRATELPTPVRLLMWGVGPPA